MKYLKKFESFKINEGLTEDLVEALYKELTELKIKKKYFSFDDYYNLMDERKLDKGMQEEILHKLVGKGFGFEDEKEDYDDNDDIILPSSYNLN